MAESDRGIEGVGLGETPGQRKSQHHQDEISREESRERGAIPAPLRRPTRGEVTEHRSRDHAEQRLGRDGGLDRDRGLRDGRMRPDEGLLPEHETPVAGQGDGAEGRGDQGRAPEPGGEEVGQTRARPAALLGRPLGGLGNFLANPQGHEGRQDTDEEHPAGLETGDELQQRDGGDGGEDAEVDGALEDGGDPRAPLPGPSLREEGRAHGPLPADPERREEPANHQLPPSLGEEG